MRVGRGVPGEVSLVSDLERALPTGSARLIVEQRAPCRRFGNQNTAPKSRSEPEASLRKFSERVSAKRSSSRMANTPRLASARSSRRNAGGTRADRNNDRASASGISNLPSRAGRRRRSALATTKVRPI